MKNVNDIVDEEEFESEDSCDVVEEACNFDKFIDAILIKETRARMVDAKEDAPNRIYAARYRHPVNERITYGRK